MKPTLALLLAVVAPASAGWTLTFGSGPSVRNGKKNVGCTAINHSKGQEFEWDRGFFDDCCVHFYSDSKCQNQNGFSCKDWKKKAGQDLRGFSVSDC